MKALHLIQCHCPFGEFCEKFIDYFTYSSLCISGVVFSIVAMIRNPGSQNFLSQYFCQEFHHSMAVVLLLTCQLVLHTSSAEA